MKQSKWYFFLIIFLLSFTMPANADTLGQDQQFFISPQYDAQSRSTVNATLGYVSEHAYFYIANNYLDDVSATARGQIIDQIKLLAQEFDSRIYPIETQFFGSEPNPGIDGDPYVTILLTPLIQNAGGYFDTANQYPSVEVRNSNQREMIYLNINEIANLNKMFAFLAHEFQHIISFNQKENLHSVSDDIWLNELRSEYAITLLGYNNVFEGSHLERRVRALQENPADSLTEWKNSPADYGQIGMFGEYIAERWSTQVIADTLKNNLAGLSNFAESLVKNDFNDTFLDVFRDWLITIFLNDISVKSKFGYSRADLTDFQVMPTRIINNFDGNTTLAISNSIKDWQGRWYDFIQLTSSQKNILKISFDSPSLTSFYISYLIFGPDGKYQLYAFNPAPSSNILYISGIGIDISRIVVMPIKKDKLSGFSANEIPVTLTTSFERVESLPANAILPLPIPHPIMLSNAIVDSSQPITSDQLQNTNLLDGSLIRASGDYKIYVIKGKWRRHIINSRIFNFYPNLGFNKVIEIDSSVLNQYQESNLVRYATDQKVYAVNENGARQWLNMSSEQFSASGRSWDAIFTINLKELQFYKAGSNITR